MPKNGRKNLLLIHAQLIMDAKLQAKWVQHYQLLLEILCKRVRTINKLLRDFQWTSINQLITLWWITSPDSLNRVLECTLAKSETCWLRRANAQKTVSISILTIQQIGLKASSDTASVELHFRGLNKMKQRLFSPVTCISFPSRNGLSVPLKSQRKTTTKIHLLNYWTKNLEIHLREDSLPMKWIFKL